MIIKNLSKNPEYREKTLKLIETSFEYKDSNSFAVDFYPLFNENNFHNCHILVKDNEVLAHIGALKRNFKINEHLFSFIMYGGIAVSEKARGQGLFKELMSHVLKLYPDQAFHILWSEKLELYEKFQFYPVGDLKAYPQIQNLSQTLIPKKMNQLTTSELNEIKNLYQNQFELRINRDEKHWEELSHIQSANIYLIREENKITNYFIKDKGQDLNNIIYEYGSIDKDSLTLMQNYGQVWTSFDNKTDFESIYLTNMHIGNSMLFKSFIKAYTNIDVQVIGLQEIEFHFEGHEHLMPINEFLLGVFGPGRFDELMTPPLFISGLDSI